MDQSKILGEVADIIRDVLDVHDAKGLRIDAETTADQTEGWEFIQPHQYCCGCGTAFRREVQDRGDRKFFSQRRGTGDPYRSEKQERNRRAIRMLFNSYSFLLWFLPVLLVGYYFLGHFSRPSLAKIWLIGASFVFYGWWNAYFVLLLVGSIAFNYLLSLAILATEEQPARQRLILCGGIVLNLAVLVYYKYLFALLGFVHSLGWMATDFGSVILPLGISFFTFTQIGYLVDCQQGLVRERGLANYVL